jgi:hypothetical protein
VQQPFPIFHFTFPGFTLPTLVLVEQSCLSAHHDGGHSLSFDIFGIRCLRYRPSGWRATFCFEAENELGGTNM